MNRGLSLLGSSFSSLGPLKWAVDHWYMQLRGARRRMGNSCITAGYPRESSIVDWFDLGSSRAQAFTVCSQRRGRKTANEGLQ